jgi:thiol:disulfide interchange protein DsbA
MRLKSLFAAFFFFLPLAACAADAGYVEGTDYRTITPPMAVDTAPGKVQALELFWYGCPHCYDLEPSVQTWLKNKPAQVEFVRVPAVFNRYQPDGRTLHPWYIHAKAFYAAEALGVGEKIHAPLFHALHETRAKLLTEDELADFFAKQGVPAADFKAAFNSFAVETKVMRAMDLTKKSGINGVPALIVAGKYQVLGKRATSFGELLSIVDGMVVRERGSR